MPPRSRNASRAASPALSVRSRRSLQSSRSRQKYVPQDLTDDEDSDIENFTDDSRSRMRRNEPKQRSRRNTEQLDLDHRETEVVNRIQKMKEKSKFIRERRSGSLTNWPVTKNGGFDRSGSLTPSDDELRKISTKFRKSSLISPTPQSKKLLSDSASEKEKELPSKQKSSVKVLQQVKSDSDDKDLPKAKVLTSKTTKKIESESESDTEPQPLPIVSKPLIVTKLESEVRPLKVTCEQQPKTVEEKQNPPIKNDEKTAKPTSPTAELTSSIRKVPEKAIEESARPIVEAWECHHCTFVNEPSATICSICCKTRVDILQKLPEADEDIDINEINESILQNENDAKQKGKTRKISFLPGTKAH